MFLLVILAAPLGRAFEDAGGGLPPGRPPLTPLHWWEDFGFLGDKNAEQKPDLFDPVKFIPLDDSNQRYFTVGLEYRERYEAWSDAGFGQAPAHDPNGYLLTRALLHGDLRLKPWLRIYAELKSVWESGREGPVRYFDEDQLDVNALFVEAGTQIDKDDSIGFRIGRQELHYGSGRLIEIRDSLNNRQSFDAAKMMLKLGNWQIDSFYSRPVIDKTGVFDNTSTDHYSFSGIYANCRQLPLIKGAGLDVYALRDDIDRIPYFKSGFNDEHRDTVGTRFYGSYKNFSYDIEPDYQFGRFGDGRINAWSSSNAILYALPKLPAAPLLSLHADAFSGDRGGDERNTLGTFNSLFPRGQYYSEPSPVGKANLLSLRPAIDWHPRPDMTFTTANIWYWRQSLKDGTYFFDGEPMAPPTNSRRYIGSESVLNYEWLVNKHVTFTAAYSEFLTGGFLKDQPHGKNFNFLATWVTLRF